MIGDVYYLTLPNTKQYYQTHGGDAAVNYAVLAILDDPLGGFNLNFRYYDNWQFRVYNQNYKHSYVPYSSTTNTGGDGYIDHVFIYWRDKSFSIPDAGGYAGLSLSQNFYSNDGVIIRSEDGTTQFNAMNYRIPSAGSGLSFGGAIHEYGHFMFGTINSNLESHFDGRSYFYNADDNNGNINSWGSMILIGAGNVNSYERYRLKWLYPSVISSSNSNVVLKDTYVENKAIMIPIRYNNNKPVEFFWIENLHTAVHYPTANPFSYTSRFDHIFPHGLLIFHIRNEHPEFPTLSNLDLMCADGNWNWGLIAGASTPNDRSDDQIDRISVNRTSAGLDEKDWIPLLTYKDYRALKPTSCIGCGTQHGWRYSSDDWLGDEKDIWNLQNNNVFSRFSNPGTYVYNGNPVDIGIEIINYNSTTREYTLNIQFGITNIINELSPSKPQNPRLFGTPKFGWVEIRWDANLESDVNLYEVSRMIPEFGGTWGVIGTTTNTFFRDTEMLYAPGGGLVHSNYRVRAKDTQNKYSIYSDVVGVRAEPLGKESYLTENVDDYELSANYPNPFNPSTIINYSVKEAGVVKIKVFDILGAEVAELVNETKEAGYHLTEFNASSLPSGVYIYTLQVNGFVSSKKMLLMK